MPYKRKGNCVYKKDSGEKKGCSDSVEKAKKYLNKLRMVGEENEFFNLDEEIEIYLAEAAQDAQVLTDLDVKKLKSLKYPKNFEDPEKAGAAVYPKLPEEGGREYHERMVQIAEEEGALFAPELIDYIRNLDDKYFPKEGRKLFAKWLGNAIYHEEKHGSQAVSGTPFKHLDSYSDGILKIKQFFEKANYPAQAFKGEWTWPEAFDNASLWIARQETTDAGEVVIPTNFGPYLYYSKSARYPRKKRLYRSRSI